MKVNARLLLIILALILLNGCATTKRVDVMDDSQVYTTFSATDLCLIAQKMTQSLVNRFNFGTERPLVRVDIVKNKTSEHIDTKAITDSIRTELVKSGKIRFAVDYLEKEDYERRSSEEAFEGRISDKDRQMYLGDQMAPRYRIYGELTGIRTITSDTKDVFYKFTLNMVDFRTGTLEWADEAKLRKVGKRGLFGM
jgi:penicillin-binding protein activator